MGRGQGSEGEVGDSAPPGGHEPGWKPRWSGRASERAPAWGAAWGSGQSPPSLGASGRDWGAGTRVLGDNGVEPRGGPPAASAGEVGRRRPPPSPDPFSSEGLSRSLPMRPSPWLGRPVWHTVPPGSPQPSRPEFSGPLGARRRPSQRSGGAPLQAQSGPSAAAPHQPRGHPPP